MYAVDYLSSRVTTPTEPTLVEITPRDAETMLERSASFVNRNVNKRRVLTYADAIRAGEWNTAVGDPIRLDTHGRVIDGQHRLLAVIESGKTQKFYLIANLPTDAVNCIDIGWARSGADFVGMRGVSRAAAVMAGLKWLYRYEAGHLSNSSLAIPRHHVSKYLDEHMPLIEESARVAENLRDISRKTAVTTGTHYLFTKISKELADPFFAQLKTGLGMDERHPVYQLRERLISGGSRLKEWETSALFIKAWNMMRTGKRVERLLWIRPREEFPTAI